MDSKLLQPKIADRPEQLFYEIVHSQDDLSLTIACLKIPSVAREGSESYDELIRASANRRIELEQQRLQQIN